MSDNAQILTMLSSIMDRLSSLEVAVTGSASPAAPAASSASASGGETPAALAAVLAKEGEALAAAFEPFGKKAKKGATFLRKCFAYVQDIVQRAETSRKPTPEEASTLGKGLSSLSSKGLRAQLPDRNMEKGLSEIFSALAAPLTPQPVQHVKDSHEAMQFYTNKVLTDAKGKDDKKANIAFVQAAEAFLTAYRKFLVPSTRGLKWKGKGDPTESAGAGGGTKTAAAPAPAAEPAPAPAPAPEPAKKKTTVNTAKKSGISKAKPAGGGLAGLFAEIGSIDQSQGKTAGLKHVTDKQKAYKNRALVKTSKVSDAPKKKKVGGKKKAAKAKKVLPPKCEYDDRQGTWFVEHQPAGARVVVTVANAGDKVYLYRCGDCVVTINGRLKALNVVNCKKTQLTFEDLLAVVEVNNCESVKLQSLGKCPAMTIDKTNGCQVYLSRTSLDCNFVCAQSSEMNVNFPTGPEGEEEEWIEQPIPEQFQHKIVGTSLTSEVSDLYSH